MTRLTPFVFVVTLVGCDGSPDLEPQGGDLVELEVFANANCETMRVAMAPNNELMIALVNWGWMNLGRSVLGSGGRRYVILARFGADLEPLWARDFELTFDTPIDLGLAVADNGDVFLSLDTLTGNIDLGGGILSGQGDLSQLNSGAVARYAGSNGDHLWSRVIEIDRDFGFDSVVAAQIAVTAEAHLLVAGIVNLRQTSIVALLDSHNGAVFWDQPAGVGSGLREIASGVVTLPDHTAIIASNDHPANGYLHAVIKKIDSRHGDLLWTAVSPNPVGGPVEVAVDREGNVLIATKLALPESNLVPDTIAVDKLAATDGAHLWSWIIGTGKWDGFANGPSLAADSANNVVVTGTFNGSVLIGERVLSSDQDAMFVLKLTSDGDALWSRYANIVADSLAAVTASDVVVARDDHILASGAVRRGGYFRAERFFLLELFP